ncbi:RING finger protein 207 [Acanthosepion pharaonis]|uniref:RING finger protein 207 n=1 Tax=Acanthosepion pharaonis TaxID=158019 RepID=A0A812DUA5_ACAPH|nr:RING finger protein 207 [Sepia pharaonis]
MFFCNTCSQPLCDICREETHKAKMFARHEIILLSKKTKEVHKRCALHGEQYIMFSTEKKVMLCINCFRDMKVESRAHCVDLETAYKQGCNKLDQAVQSIQDLQNTVKEGIQVLRSLLVEIRQNSEAEKDAINQLYDSMQQRIAEKKKELLEEVERQYQVKEKLFKAQLLNLNTLLPTLHVNLVTCSAFCSSANKFEFLNLSFALMERLHSIAQKQHPLRPTQGSQINTDHKNEYANNTLQVKSGLLFSKRYTCAFLLPIYSLPSSHLLDNQDGVVWSIPFRTCSPQVTFLSTANTFASYNLPKSARPTPHVQHLRGLTCTGATCLFFFFTGDPSVFPGLFSFS